MSMYSAAPLGVAALTLVFFSGRAAVAQCSNPWLAWEGASGVGGLSSSSGIRASTMWDPDGAGPQPPLLVVAGTFTIAGAVNANRIATWNPATGAWGTLGTGLGVTTDITNSVDALAVLPSGQLIAGGNFTTPANRIARWNGTSWSGLGSGMNQQVFALAPLPSGDLVAGGAFTTAGGVPVSRIALWNGASWSSLGPTPVGASFSNDIISLAVMQNGDVVAGGHFGTANGGVSASRIARWNGSSWSALGSGLELGPVALAVLSNGELAAVGPFQLAGGQSVRFAARWNGASWSAMGPVSQPLGTGFDGPPQTLTFAANGDLLAGGWFTKANGPGAGVPANRVARWNGSAWSAATGMDVWDGDVQTLTVLTNGDLVAGGVFKTAGGIGVGSCARWDGAIWQRLSPGINGVVYAVAACPNGEIVVGGDFTSIGNVTAHRVARWSGSTWVALGSGTDDTVEALLALPNGDIVAGGFFSAAGGVAGTTKIARWNGVSWSSLGGGIDPSTNSYVSSLVLMANGDLAAGGYYFSAGGVSMRNVARWNGVAWSPVGSGAWGNAPVYALLVRPNGNLVAGGSFTDADNVFAPYVAQWDGLTWSAMGNFAIGMVHCLAIGASGEVIAGTDSAFGSPTVARWDDVSWIGVGSMTNGPVNALAVLPNGDLIAAGGFLAAGFVAANRIARWNGISWSAMGSGMNSGVNALTIVPTSSSHLVVGGSFTTAAGIASLSLARLATSCPASANLLGSGCSGSSGPVALIADTLPWTGNTFRSTATGIGPSSIALSLVGTTQTSVPASAVHPAGLPGCTLLVNPDVQMDFLLFPVAGAVHPTLAIPNTTSLVGVVGYMQVAQLELDLSLAITQISTSNALTLTVGRF